MSRHATAREHANIDVFDMAREGAEVGGRLAFTRMPRLLTSLALSQGGINYTYRGSIDERGRPAGRLAFAGTAQLKCDRCGAVVPVELSAQATYYFVRSAEELDRIPVDDADDEPLLGSQRFDLQQLIEDETILALPISPRHDACQSLAPLARERSDAGDEPARSGPEEGHPFAALAQLKARRK